MKYIAIGLAVLSLMGCEADKEPQAEMSAEQSACVTRAVEAEAAKGLAEAQSAMAESQAAIDSGNLGVLFDTDFVDEAISDRDTCEAYAACFEFADAMNKAMYLQNCTTERMQQRLDDQL